MLGMLGMLGMGEAGQVRRQRQEIVRVECGHGWAGRRGQSCIEDEMQYGAQGKAARTLRRRGILDS